MCQVIPLRKAFLNSLIPLANNMSQGQIRRLNTAARIDLARWQIMLDNWPGTSIDQFLLLQEPSHHLYSDASGSWGCGAFSLPAWLQFAWPRENPLHSIALKELFPIVPACLVWGHQCPLPLQQCGSSMPSQSPLRSTPNSSPPLALLGTVHGTVLFPHSDSSYCQMYEYRQ